MARLNVYLPDELVAEVRAVGLNVSYVTRTALHRELARFRTQGWLQRVALERTTKVSHETSFGALRAVDPDL